MPDSSKFTVIRNAARIWAVGAVHGEVERLSRLHEKMTPELRFGDRLIYLGNYLGYSDSIRETVDELLRFRRLFLTIPPYMDSDDVTFLRGSQEEMWHKLLQLQFSVKPLETLEWLLARGVNETIRAYGGDPAQGIEFAGDGTIALGGWTSALRDAFNAASGHSAFMSALKRAAYTDDKSLLFVNAGLDETQPLAAQTDEFWWTGGSFNTIAKPYDGFSRIFRGYDANHGGFNDSGMAMTVDGGCGFGGSLIAVCLSPAGEIIGSLEA